jgi:winged helix domain-containing protein/ATPase family protein associated with various cellular activities (AAA)
LAAASLAVRTADSTNEVNPCLAALWPAMQRLDSLLDGAVRAMQPVRGSDSAALFRGLYIEHKQVTRLLSQSPGTNPFGGMRKILDPKRNASPSDTPLTRVMEEFQLSPFEADVMLIALAPELDLRYERIYAYLQDDITRKRPTVELTLNLLCENADAKLDCRVHFLPQAPLLRHGLAHLVPDSNQAESSLLAHSLKLDDRICRLLLGQDGLDNRLTPFCKLIEPAIQWSQLPLSGEIEHALPQLASQSLSEKRPLCLYFRGPASDEKQATAEALAGTLGVKLLCTRIDRLRGKEDADSIWGLLSREGRILRAVLYISEFDDLHGADSAVRRQDLLEAVAKYPGITILAGRQDWIPSSSLLGVLPVDFEIPGFVERCACWKASLEGFGASCEPNDIAMVAGRFQLSSEQIAQAVATAIVRTHWRAAGTSSSEDTSGKATPAAPTVEDLAAAARSQCGHELASLARKIEPRYEWSDIILPPDPKTQLQEICHQAEFRSVVFDQWGFNRKLSLGKGLNVLFSGPPGTGKTMGAEVIANKLGLDLYRIDLSQVVSKYIGETEKNLDRIFTAAERSNAILFFDEADALFGKRSEVRDSHDRYANIEISYLLQKMEEYQGMSILATNLRQNLDEAFVRRLQAIVEFPFPDEAHRRKIWERVFPPEAPLAEDVKFDLLAREVRLAGGNIRNMALTAAFAAAADQGVIHLSHLVQAAHREHQKLARSWSPGALAAAVAAHA